MSGDSPGKLYRTRGNDGSTQLWKEVPLKVWDYADSREILYLGKKGIVFVVRVA